MRSTRLPRPRPARPPRPVLTALAGWPRRLAATGCLVLAAVSALASAHQGRSATAGADLQPVVVAAHALAPGGVLGPADLRIARWPRADVPPTARSWDAVLGRRIGAAMSAGEPVTTARLLDTAVVAALQPGQVAATVPLVDHGQAGLICAGSSVDLYAGVDPTLLVDGHQLGGSGAPVAHAVRVIAVLSPPTQSATAALSLVVAVDAATAARLSNRGNTPYLATLRPPG